MVHDRPNIYEWQEQPVAVLFEQDLIKVVFSDLLEARGVPTVIIEGVNELAPGARVITEVQFFSQLPPAAQARALVVGNKDTLRDLPALALSRPLTEEKVEVALVQFLRPQDPA